MSLENLLFLGFIKIVSITTASGSDYYLESQCAVDFFSSRVMGKVADSKVPDGVSVHIFVKLNVLFVCLYRYK